jgi:hypothetical protein
MTAEHVRSVISRNDLAERRMGILTGERARSEAENKPAEVSGNSQSVFLHNSAAGPPASSGFTNRSPPESP